MCGITLAVGDAFAAQFTREVNLIQRHRGPDGDGVFDASRGASTISLGHQRLAILDLSERGRQPMRSHSERLVMTFNGEIYNYRALAEEFGLQHLRSGTDSEVILEVIERVGIERASRAFNGMWALAVYDQRDGRVYLSRDRFGKKPLYYTVCAGTTYAASEGKAFACIPEFERRTNHTVAARYLAQSLQDLDEQTWLQDVYALPAASTGYIDTAAPEKGVQGIARFWRLDPQGGDKGGDDDAFVAQLRDTVNDSVALRLHADVPVGIALSGGLDSSIIAAVARQEQERTGQRTTLFSAVHPGAREDESGFVDIVAKHLDVDVQKFSLADHRGDELVELLERCTLMNDGPIASFSDVLFYKLMQRAQEIGVKVILTGQGADEVFCGYRKYVFLELRRLLKRRQFVGAAAMLTAFLRQGTIIGQFKLSEAKRYLGKSNRPLLGASATAALTLEDLQQLDGGMGERQRLDVERYSVPYLTHYEDRMSMAWSREVRSPFLDYRIVEMGVRADTERKLQGGWTKYCLRQAFDHALPAQITWRKDKQGFVNPQGTWIRTTLREHIEAMIGDREAPVFAEELVDREGYSELYRQFCAGKPGIWLRDVFAPFTLNAWMTSLRSKPQRASLAAAEAVGSA